MVALRLSDHRTIGDTLRFTGRPRLFLAFACRGLIASVRVVRHARSGAKSVPVD
jgi:hypothetical protein